MLEDYGDLAEGLLALHSVTGAARWLTAAGELLDVVLAEFISDEQRPQLKAFMADLCWIENIGARGFAALAKKAPTPTIWRS